MKNIFKRSGLKVFGTLMMLLFSFVAIAAGSVGNTGTPALSSFNGIELSALVTLGILLIIVAGSKGR
jgi:hypothetical protein